MIYVPGEPKKDITLRIETVVIDDEAEDPIINELEKLLATLDDGGAEPIVLKNALESDSVDKIELCTEATVETNANGHVEISYMENEDDPQIASLSKIIFSADDMGLVSMTKNGAINAILSFEEGKTHICTYETPFMPLKVYVTSSKVDNRLLNDGFMKLNYTLNINDTAPQHFIITVSIKDAPEDIFGRLLQ